MRTLSVGFIGLAHLHPRSYMPLFAATADAPVVAVAEANPAVLDAFTREFPVHGYADWREMLDKESLDLAGIFLPHAECPDAAVACAERRIHVLVEKPMAASAAGVQRMITATQQAGVLLSTAYCWRYHPVAREMRRLVQQGVLGSPVGGEGRCAAGRLHRYIEGNARWMLTRALSGGGPMFNLGVHWIDLYRWMLDDEVVEVFGKNVKVNQEYDIEDNSFALLTFSRGTVIALDISYTVPDAYPYGRDLSLSLRGTGGTLAWTPSYEGVRETLFVCSDSGDFASAPRRHLNFELTTAAGYSGIMGQQFIDELVAAIREGKPAAITGEDGLRALQVVEAIYRSAQSGAAVRV